jgi:hypothetical protein
MKQQQRAMGWNRDQWTASLQFFDRSCDTIEDFAAQSV